MKPEYSANAKKIYEKLYLKRDKEDNIQENIETCHRRVSYFLANNEREEEEFFELLQEKKFRPNTPAMANAGINPDHSLCACYVLGLHDSMKSIIEMWSTVAEIYSGGGGAGIPITNLRPAGASISTGGQASGPLSYAKVIQSISDQVRSGGKNRRAANLLSFWYKHKDIFDLIKMKDGNNDFSAMNISVLVDDDFMKSTEWCDLWPEIITQAWKTGDPGLLFYDSINRDNPFPSLGGIVCGNPCSEVVLPPWSACDLGHMNLNSYLNESGFFNFSSFYEGIDVAVRFLNRIIDKSSHPNPKFKETMQKIRPIGLGLMGFADLLYKRKIPYNSKEAKNVFDDLTRILTIEAYESSIRLAKDEDIKVQCPPEDAEHFLKMQERFGVECPTLQIANSTVTCLAPTGSTAISADASYSFEPMFALVWSKKLTDSDEVLYFADKTFAKYCSDNGIDLTPEVKQKIADNNGSIRHLKEFDEETQNIFVTAHDISWRDRLEMQAAGQKNITMSISSTVNLPNNASVKDVEGVYKTAYELGLKGITVYRDGCREDQPINFGGKAKKNEVDIEIVEMMVKEMMEEGSSSWASDVYEKEQYLADLIIQMIGKYCPQATLEETENASVQERPQELFGRTVKMRTGSGELYLTINEFNGVPFEVFATIGKGGRSMSAKAEAIGRLVSLCLRAGVSVREIVKQLDGIGGDYPIFQEGRLIKSIPDAIATVLRGYEDKKKEEVTIDTGGKWSNDNTDPLQDITDMKEMIKNQTGLENIPLKDIPLKDIPQEHFQWDSKGTEKDLFEIMEESEEEYRKVLELHDTDNICPECGQPTFSYSSGCRGGMCKNPECGFSNCG